MSSLIFKGFGGPLWLTKGYGGAAIPSNLPDSLPAALAALVRGDSLISDLAGGYFGNHLPTRAAYPCAVGFVREGRVESRTNSNDRVLTPILLRVYSPDADEAYTLSARLDSAVAGECLDFTGALVTKLLRDGEPTTGWQAGRSPTGEIHYCERKYCCRVRRPRVVVRLS